VLALYPKIFAPESLTRQNFLALYAQVCSRCFGWDLPNTSMIPMADNFNHADVHVTFEFCNKSLHLQGDEDCSYFGKGKFMNDYSLAFEGQTLTQNAHLLNVGGRFAKSAFAKNQEIESYSYIETLMKQKFVWDIDCEKDRKFEDNDTESDGEDEHYRNIEKAIENANGRYVVLPEKHLPQNFYPTVGRKHREYI
jgi:hypothetical protein